MTKPVYRHPHFVIRTAEKRIQKENKRLWLNITIDKEKDESIVVILKNPSRATKDISDKTVFKKHAHVIVAWGDCPKGLYTEYEVLKNTIISYLKANNNKVYYVDKLSKSGNPKHGQIWGYDNHLLPFKIQ